MIEPVERRERRVGSYVLTGGSVGATVVADVAGAAMGGARRYLTELDGWLAKEHHPVRVIGRNRAMGPSWLVSREVMAARVPRTTTVALNNVSFGAVGISRLVLLRNALHFLFPREAAELPPKLLRRWEMQTRVVRLMLRRADRIVVPSSAMRERVLGHCPWTGDRIEVLPHPLSPLPVSGDSCTRGPIVVCPVLDAPYKQLGKHLSQLLLALSSDTGLADLKVVATSTAEELEGMGLPPSARLVPAGRLPTAAMTELLEGATALFFPTDLESFGYPLAEARVNRVPVLAKRTALTTEVAGDALVPYESDDIRSLTEALVAAMTLRLQPLSENPFDPDSYFRRLFFPREAHA